MTGPVIGENVTLNDPAFIHDTAIIHGKVRLEEGASVWPYVVFRAEMYEVVIGARTNIQDHVMVHVGNRTGTYVGEDCSITHKVCLHGCTIGDKCLIGIGATIMDGAKIGANSIVAGHSIVTENSEFPENSIIAGVPAKQVVHTRLRRGEHDQRAVLSTQCAEHGERDRPGSRKMI